MRNAASGKARPRRLAAVGCALAVWGLSGIKESRAAETPVSSPAPAPSASASTAAALLPVQTRTDVPYLSGGAADAQRALDVYLPQLPKSGAVDDKKALTPLFVYLHGGAWVSGDKRQYRDIGNALAARGIAVAIVNYRLSGDGIVRHPAHALDVAIAVGWLRKHAAELGVDAARIFVGGHSAGAHISALLAYDPSLLAAVGEKPTALRGFVGLEGIYDLPELVRRFPRYRSDFLTDAFGADEKDWRAASPTQLPIGHKLPWLIVHSQEDELVDVEQSRRWKATLSQKGVNVRYLLLAQGSHFGVLLELLKPESPLWKQLLEFLRT